MMEAVIEGAKRARTRAPGAPERPARAAAARLPAAYELLAEIGDIEARRLARRAGIPLEAARAYIASNSALEAS